MYRRTIPRTRWHWLKLISLFVPLAFVGIVFIVALRLYLSLQIATTAGMQLARILQQDGLSQTNLQIADELIDQTRTALHKANRDTQLVEPALKSLAWLPKIGASLAALPTVVDGVSQLAEIANQTYRLTQPLLLAGQALPATLPEIAAAHPLSLSLLITATSQLDSQLASLEPERLIEPLATAVAQVQSAVALLHGGLVLSEQLPAMLGYADEQRLLVLVQNNFELRATGGFITAIGVLTINNGEIKDFSIEDSYSFPDGDGPFPRAPLPMQRYMYIHSLLLRDVNWSPDFPSTAQLASTLYYQQSNQRVDGVITVDLRAVELFVEALQTIRLPSSPEPITSSNLVVRMKEMWSLPPTLQQTDAPAKEQWWAQRKDFIPLLATAILQRLQSADVNPLAVAHALHRSIEERAIQYWRSDLQLQANLTSLGWDGGLRVPPNQDFLALVDSNFGYNKVDAVLQRSLYYQLQWESDPSGRGVATVLLTYRHPLEVENAVCDARPEYGDDYDDMMARCYFDFVRLYVPPGSELVGIDGIEEGSQYSQLGEGGAVVFGGYFRVRPGEEKKLIIQYLLPSTITRQHYRLTVRKQAGVFELPFTIWDGTNMATATIRNGLWSWQPGMDE